MEWFKKHKVLSIGGGVLVALWLVGGLGSSTAGTSQATQPAVQATQAAAAVNVVQPQPTVQAPAQVAPTLSNDNTYTNVDGNTVHSPAYTSDNSVPDGASAQCADGTYSFSQHRSGTCSHHGGVAEWLY